MEDRPPQSFSSTGSAAAAGQRVKAEAKAEAEARKDRAAGRVDDVASAMDRAADELHDNPTLSRYAADLAGSMHGVAVRMRERSVDDLAEEVRQLARSNPALFVLGSVGAGFALARFMKASPRREHGSRADRVARSSDERTSEDASAGFGVPLTATSGIGSSEAGFPAGASPRGGPDYAAPNTDTRRA
jgi:hypothetical protein